MIPPRCAVQRILKLPEVRNLVTSLKGRDKHDEVEVVDDAYWMKGWSSLDRLRFTVLLGGGKKKKKRKAPMPRDYAKRIVHHDPKVAGSNPPPQPTQSCTAPWA